MNSGKIVADGTGGRDGTGDIEGSTRGPRGPKNDILTAGGTTLRDFWDYLDTTRRQLW